MTAATSRSARGRPPVVVDASVWISWLTRTDSNNLPATKWLNMHINGGGEMVAPALLLTEVAAVVRRATGNANNALTLAMYLGNFQQLTILGLDEGLMSEATRVAAQFALKAPDAIYVAVAGLLGIPLVTFDKEQLTRPVGYITAVQP